MFEEPFRFVEAIANRREYIENQIASPAVRSRRSTTRAVSCCSRSGASGRRFFEIYDRIALAAIGHPRRHRAAADDGHRTRQHGRFHPVGGGCFVAPDGELFHQPRAQGGVRAGIRRTLSRADVVRGTGSRAGAEHVSPARLRRRDPDDGTPFSKSRQEYAALSGTRASAEQMERFWHAIIAWD